MRKKKVIKKISKITKGQDYVLGVLVLGLSIFGLMMVYNVSTVLAYEKMGDTLWYFKNQTLWLVFGLLVGFVASKIDYHFWQKLALPLLVASVIGLVLVFIPGFSSQIMGSRRRLALPLGVPALNHINIQPSELAKFSLVLFLSRWLSKEAQSARQKGGQAPRKVQSSFIKRINIKKVSILAPFLVLLGVILGLVAFEPDLGTAAIIAACALLVYFLSGVSIVEVGLVSALFSASAALFALTSEYRLNRLLSFFRHSEDKLGISYHINQVLIALGSGGLFGLGLGQSRQKHQYLPEVATDSIFAIIGEELGFLGASIIVVAFLILIWRGLKIAERAPDKFGKLLAGGITGIVGIQAMVNLCTMVGLLPLTGVPLPFISYGGSSLTILLLGMGILINISGFYRPQGTGSRGQK